MGFRSIVNGAVDLGVEMKEKRVDLITSTGNWTAPSGVTYVIATIVSGGGGGGGNNIESGFIGGESSAFGTTAPGGNGGHGVSGYFTGASFTGAANTGMPGSTALGSTYQGQSDPWPARELVVGASVTPGTTYTITIGAGGAGRGGGAAGGSGFVNIEYYV